jgi:hypothetical protein
MPFAAAAVVAYRRKHSLLRGQSSNRQMSLRAISYHLNNASSAATLQAFPRSAYTDAVEINQFHAAKTFGDCTA